MFGKQYYNIKYNTNAYEDLVSQWFHDCLEQLKLNEIKYFKETDTLQIKLTKLRELGDRYRTCFGNKTLNDIVWNRKTNVEETVLDKYISASITRK